MVSKFHRALLVVTLSDMHAAVTLNAGAFVTNIIYEAFQEWTAGPRRKAKLLATFNALAEKIRY